MEDIENRKQNKKAEHMVITLQLLVLAALLILMFVKSREAAETGSTQAGWYDKSEDAKQEPSENGSEKQNQDFIRWVDFTVPETALEQAFRLDIESVQEDVHLNWVDLLACMGARYGGDFKRYRASDMKEIAEQLRNGTPLAELTESLKYFPYYREAYGAVLDGMVGYFEQEIDGETAASPVSDPTAPESSGRDTVWVTKYGLKAFSPIAKNFPYNDYDDFGVARSYGYKRQHLGHDMMGQVGTPIIAVESGTVEALGWNQYGGWRIGIRSFDKKRYYYYAHLRQNYPYQSSLSVGSTVTAGDVIGYLGRTGYSATENTNNIDTPHLHFGLQLIFDESQKEGYNEIWIDCYELLNFLHMNQSEVVKVDGTKEWTRVYGQKETK